MTEATAVLAAELTANPDKLIEGFKRAEQATGAWAQAAARNVATAQASFGGLDFSVVTSKAKAEQLKLIELQHQLDVARAAGEKKTVAQLSEEIALLQKVRQLRSAGLTAPDAQAAARAHFTGVSTASAGAAARAKAEREAEEAAEAAALRRERVVGNPGEALEGVFSRSRLAVLEEGGAKIPIFGSSLEALGVAGLAAAAGLAAVGIAAEHARESLEFAEELEKTSKTLGVSTTALQEFDEAAISTGVGQDKARESLQQFNEVFGKYSAGLASGRSAKFLDALGFTPESARQVGDVSGALEKALLALAKLQNPQQRASLANQLGLENFLPVIAEGQEGVERFVAAMRAAGTSGSIISPDQIAKAAELNDKVELLAHRIDQEFKAAFIDAGPAIEKVAEFIESCTRNLTAFIGEIPDAVRGLQLFNFRVGGIGGGATPSSGSPLGGSISPIPGVSAAVDIAQLVKSGVDALAKRGRRVQISNGISDLLAGKVTDPEGRRQYEALGQTTRGVDLAPPAKAKKGPADESADFDKAAADAADTGAKDLATARAALTKNISAHAEAELAAIDAETDKKLKDLAAEEVKVRESKNDAHRKSQLALLETAKTDALATAEAKKELVTRQAEQAQAQADLQFQQRQDAYHDAILTAQASLATSAHQRADLQLQVFRDQQNAALDSRRQSDADAVQDGTLTQDQSDQDVAGLRGQQNAELVAKRTDTQRSINPLYARAKPSTSVGDDLQGIEAKGLDGLTDSLTSIVTQSGNAKEAFHNLISSMITDLARLAIQRDIEQPLANLLFGASSTNNLGNLGQTGGSVSIGGIASGLGNLLSGVLGGGNSSGVPGAHDIDSSAFGALDALRVPSILPTLLGGAFAGGTDSTPGGLTRYNELGTEGYVPPGAQIIPNSTLKGLASLTPDRLGTGGGMVSHQISIDLTGANGDETIRQISYEAAARGTAQAIATSRSDAQKAAIAGRRDLTRF